MNPRESIALPAQLQILHDITKKKRKGFLVTVTRARVWQLWAAFYASTRCKVYTRQKVKLFQAIPI